MNSLPFGQVKSFLKILIGVQYERALHPNFLSLSSLRSATSPKGRGKGGGNRLMRSAHSVGCFLRYVITPEQKSPAAPFGAAGLIRFMGSA